MLIVPRTMTVIGTCISIAAIGRVNNIRIDNTFIYMYNTKVNKNEKTI